MNQVGLENVCYWYHCITFCVSQVGILDCDGFRSIHLTLHQFSGDIRHMYQ